MTQPLPDDNKRDAAHAAPVFPCTGLPSEQRHVRMLGIYPQRQPERFMQRVRIPGGILTADQWRTLADLARQFTPATPLHLTTRQDIELHDVRQADLPDIHQMLSQAGLTTLGSGGDTLRNIIVCPCAGGGTADVPNLLPLAEAITQTLAAYENLFALPRKFKISLGCQDGCGFPFTHDLAFQSVQRDGRWGLKVVGAGSLGARPELGIVLFDWIEPAEAMALSLAAVRVFNRHGDRQNRTKARLRHVRQRLGDEPFLAELTQEFVAAKSERLWPEVQINLPAQAWGHRQVLTFANGDIAPEAADALAALAQRDGISVRIGIDHRVFVFNAPGLAADGGLMLDHWLLPAARSQASVIACPGTRWCSHGLVDTNGLAGRIRAALAQRRGAGLTVAISGCPNGCAANAVADIGISGGRGTADGQPIEKYSITSGGGNGATNIMGQPVAAGLSAEQTLAEIIRPARKFGK